MTYHSVRQLAKATLCNIFAGNWATISSRSAQRRSAILCYHSIDAQTGVSPASLGEHIQFLKTLGYAFQTFGELAHRLHQGSLASTPTAVLTFDDGFADNFTQAMPVLAEHRVRATFFVTSGLIVGDPDALQRCERLTHTRGPWLTPAQLRQIIQSDMEIGAHTHTHPNLARLESAHAHWELSHARQTLEQLLSAPVKVMAYPFGRSGIHHTPQTRQLVHDCGYVAAASTASRTVSHRDDALQLPRFFVTAHDTPATLDRKLKGDMNWLGYYHDASPAWLKRIVAPEEDYA